MKIKHIPKIYWDQLLKDPRNPQTPVLFPPWTQEVVCGKYVTEGRTTSIGGCGARLELGEKDFYMKPPSPLGQSAPGYFWRCPCCRGVNLLDPTGVPLHIKPLLESEYLHHQKQVILAELRGDPELAAGINYSTTVEEFLELLEAEI